MAFDARESGLFVPDELTAEPAWVPSGAIIDNRTDLPDEMVQQAVATYFEETAAFSGPTSFQSYASEGSMLARMKWEAPANVFDEMRLARRLADQDDDVRGTIGAMLAIAFKDGMRHLHEDEEALVLWNKMAATANLDHALKRIYREYLVTGQVTTCALFTPKSYQFTHSEVSRTITRRLAAPLIGTLRSENVRSVGDDMFGNAPLAYVPDPHTEIRLGEWLRAYFSDTTSAAKKRELQRQQPVWAYLFVERVQIENDVNLIGGTMTAYRLNPRACHRLKMPTDGPYARPPLLANFALLEAKRLLNIMDYALLQGGQNYIVIAKKGTDQRPALPEEIANLREVVRRASRSGVVIGDHRLSIEVVTPDLTELLNPDKRNMIGRKLSAALLRAPDGAIQPSGNEAEKALIEIISAVITSDRQDIRRHVEGKIYEETQQRNAGKLPNDAATLWFPKILLQGLQYFTDLVLKLRDRGDIPRSYAVEAGGWDYDAAVRQRKREKARGDDKVMVPGQVPFSSPNAGPQDNPAGRPPRGTGPDSARPRRLITRNRGETVRAEWDEETESVVRVGELTAAILEEYPEHSFGRMTSTEQRAVDEEESFQEGPVIVVPVNQDMETEGHRVIRLAEGISLIAGMTTEAGAIVACALVFRDESFTIQQAEDRAIAWGYELEVQQPTPAPEPAAG